MFNKTDIVIYTEQLMNYIDFLSSKFAEVKETGVQEDFHSTVMPFCNEIKICNEKWRSAVVAWIETEKPKYVTNAQVETAAKQIEQISVQAFFPKTSRAKFNHSVKSLFFILHVIISENKKDKEYN